jgi:hypothetical protein
MMQLFFAGAAAIAMLARFRRCVPRYTETVLFVESVAAA